MRVLSLIPAALALEPAAVSAAGTLGFALGDKNPDGTCKSTSDYEADFDALKPYTTVVRNYAANDCDTAKNIIPAAKMKGFKVVMGVWPDTDQSFRQDTDALRASVPGNEDVIEAITVQKMFPSVTVGTADSGNKYADGTADALVQGGVTYLLGNAFAYWQGASSQNASKVYFDDVAQALEHVQKVAGDNAKNIRFLNGETGWPTDGGSNYGAATAGTHNAETYYQDAVCGMLKWGVDVFYFEAFDEPWKPKSVGDNGQAQDETHWGFMTAERKLKFNGTC